MVHLAVAQTQVAVTSGLYWTAFYRLRGRVTTLPLK